MDQAQSQAMELSPLDQIMVRGIVRLILCFPVRDPTDRPLIVETIQRGLDDTVRQMPYLSGEVREKGNLKKEIEVVYKEGDKVKLLARDVGKELPTYQDLHSKQMPPSYFDDELLSPMRNMPESSKQSHPVMAMQANFIRGGLFLCVCFHHSVLDGAGFAHLLKMLGNNCSNVRKPEAFLMGEDSTDRGGLFRNIPPARGPDQRTDGYPEYFLEDPKSMVPPESGAEEPPTTARLFYIRKSDLQNLKASAAPEDAKRWISSHHALGALVWSRITLARSSRDSNKATSKFCIFVNCRGRLKGIVPEDFIGNVCVGAQAQLKSTKVLDSKLSVLAGHIQKAIGAVDRDYVLGLVKHVKEYPADITCIKPGIQSYMGNDINLVSWRAFDVYDMNFGSYLGKPEWFRCPWRTLDGTVKILPERRVPRPGSSEEGFEVNVELREDDMERLLHDAVWTAYAQEVLH
ncbi:MAG: hypothetical protein LQ340_003638 [Diploschistes diacapsis]|nr:MAG: hypothetical protein LQ340_003638 [Diploschistes diacapsis]